MPEQEQVLLRRRYEHYTSTPKDRALYITLGFMAVENEPEPFVLYCREGKEDKVFARQLGQFIGEVKPGKRRMTLIDGDDTQVIDTDRRDEIYAETDYEYEIRS
jgi:hypothetical protein